MQRKNDCEQLNLYQNDVCFGDGSVREGATQLSGNCFTKQECDELKGTAAGDCADGYGVCCVCKIYSGHHWKVYECCFMKQNCHFQRGLLQLKNATTPLNSSAIHTTH